MKETVVKISKKKKSFMIIVIILVVVILLATATFITLNYLNRKKAEKLLLEAQTGNISAPKNSSSGGGASGSSSSGSSGSSSGANTGSSTVVTGNDTYPLKIGSSGENVKYLQRFINKISSRAKLKEDGIFTQDVYNKLITLIGTRFYPVTRDNWIEIADMANKK